MKKTILLLCVSCLLALPVQAEGPMQNAKIAAQTALEKLQDKATTDKGGHRAAAIKHLKAAIAEIDAGIEFDKANVTKGEGKKKKN
ncbi:MAG TPA: hypothetical protein P5016_12585 [Verrucomicrobiales bacterium]|nr:hypothetical protein [Verrucomicrobiae bacterium]MCP5553477.1 hypothetical protein [Akkermansiaceae bacterium]HRX55349.1 hypothetical protein [Verrucomicrobiales bacterium]